MCKLHDNRQHNKKVGTKKTQYMTLHSCTLWQTKGHQHFRGQVKCIPKQTQSSALCLPPPPRSTQFPAFFSTAISSMFCLFSFLSPSSATLACAHALISDSRTLYPLQFGNNRIPCHVVEGRLWVNQYSRLHKVKIHKEVNHNVMFYCRWKDVTTGYEHFIILTSL